MVGENISVHVWSQIPGRRWRVAREPRPMGVVMITRAQATRRPDGLWTLAGIRADRPTYAKPEDVRGAFAEPALGGARRRVYFDLALVEVNGTPYRLTDGTPVHTAERVWFFRNGRMYAENINPTAVAGLHE